MSRSYEIECMGHNSIYTKGYEKGNYKKRKFKVYFNEPDNGIDKDTGIILFIAGFGGNSQSNVYKKMRDEFADKYNLVPIQCDYFGNEFMQDRNGKLEIEKKELIKLKEILGEEYIDIFNEGNIDFQKLIERNEEIKLKFIKKFRESKYNFNDMGIMQAIDNITATLNVIEILHNNNLKFNKNKIIVMGQSHGAYLAYLCNRFCPNLYTDILDNSAWNYPKYIKNMRCVTWKIGKVEGVEFNNYLAFEMGIDIEKIRIRYLYENFKNNCNITIYHGEGDSLILPKEKEKEIIDIENVDFNLIGDREVDGEIFKNSSHGLGADFLNLFEKYNKEKIKNRKNREILLQDFVKIKEDFEIDYTEKIPKINLKNFFKKD